MTIKLSVVQIPCTLYPACPYKDAWHTKLGGIGAPFPDRPPCGNCYGKPQSTPETEPGKWQKIG